MRRKFLFALLAIVIAAASSNCVTDQEFVDEPSIKERVASAKIIPGEVVLQQYKTAIYIEIPSTRGYLAFDVQNPVEKDEILKEVYRLYKKEFDENKEISPPVNSRIQQNVACGEWAPISQTDPNSYVTRYCCDLDNGVCHRETCQCGYCCRPGGGTS